MIFVQLQRNKTARNYKAETPERSTKKLDIA
jgi:hypothetical protein